MTAQQRLTRQAQLAKLVRGCRYRLDPDEFPGSDSDGGGPRKRRQSGVKRVTIDQVASQSGYSYAWHSALERGKDERYSDDFLSTVAKILKMTADETDMLFSLALRRRPGIPEEDLRDSRVIQWALDEISCPAYIIDSAWDVLSFNKPMAEWFPWSTGAHPNFMRWAFLAAEARIHLHNWDTEWGPQLWAEMQYNLAHQPDNKKLKNLISEILDRSRAARLINENPLEFVNPDGMRRRVRLPVHNNKIHVVEQVAFAPMRAPASRVMMIVPLDDTQH